VCHPANVKTVIKNSEIIKLHDDLVSGKKGKSTIVVVSFDIDNWNKLIIAVEYDEYKQNSARQYHPVSFDAVLAQVFSEDNRG
jgi:hypothetical protein